MNVKIDTKEKFSVITPQVPEISANMTDEWERLMLSYLENPKPHLVVNMENVRVISRPAAEKLATVQQQFYEKNCSLIICCLTEAIEAQFEKDELLETMNVTPTESEAWDIMHMEEIERELLDDEI